MLLNAVDEEDHLLDVPVAFQGLSPSSSISSTFGRISSSDAGSGSGIDGGVFNKVEAFITSSQNKHGHRQN